VRGTIFRIVTEPTSSRSGAGRFAPGQVIADKFRIDRILGEGGMGVVVAATHLQLDERVALKFLRTEVNERPDLVKRFTQEARAAVKLKSEYVARTYDVGLEDGAPYIVMEFLDGHDLGQELATQGVLPVDVAAEYVIQACAGIAEAHARGIVHRDIKPENMFLTRRGDGTAIVKILDFGISMLGTNATAGRGTFGGMVLGSPLYMCPEQLRGKPVDFRADIWSLGAVLFELLTGEAPFGGIETEVPRLMQRITNEPAPKLSEARPTAPSELDAIIERCLMKEPSERYASAAELAIALLKFAPKRARVPAEHASGVSRAAGLSSDEKLELPPSIAPPSAPVVADRSSARIGLADTVEVPSIREEPPKRRPPFVLIGAAALLGVGALVYVMRPTPAPRPVIVEATTSSPSAAMPVPMSTAPVDLAATKPASLSTVDPTPPAAPSASASAADATHPTVRQPSSTARHSSSPPTSSPAPSSRPDLDIRMTR
jgi:serine/threonine-protein kinase